MFSSLSYEVLISYSFTPSSTFPFLPLFRLKHNSQHPQRLTVPPTPTASHLTHPHQTLTSPSRIHHSSISRYQLLFLISRPHTATYTHILSATTERRKHLRYGKFFDCTCDRCSDPTELGTYFGALKCSQPGCGGSILSTDPLLPTNDAPWACDRCKYQVSGGVQGICRWFNVIPATLEKNYAKRMATD